MLIGNRIEVEVTEINGLMGRTSVRLSSSLPPCVERTCANQNREPARRCAPLFFFPFFSLFLDSSAETLLQRAGVTQLEPGLLSSPKAAPLFDGVVHGEVVVYHCPLHPSV